MERRNTHFLWQNLFWADPSSLFVKHLDSLVCFHFPPLRGRAAFDHCDHTVLAQTDLSIHMILNNLEYSHDFEQSWLNMVFTSLTLLRRYSQSTTALRRGWPPEYWAWPFEIFQSPNQIVFFQGNSITWVLRVGWWTAQAVTWIIGGGFAWRAVTQSKHLFNFF